MRFGFWKVSGLRETTARGGSCCGGGADILSGDVDIPDRGLRMLPVPDWGLRCHESVPERLNAAALGAGFFGSTSSRACAGGEPVRRCSDSSRAACCDCEDGGSMTGVGVSESFGVPSSFVGDLSGCCARELLGVSWGVVGLSGERERARSVCKHGEHQQPES